MNSKVEIIRIINNQLEIPNIIISKEILNTINRENLYTIMVRKKLEIQSLHSDRLPTQVRTKEMKVIYQLEHNKSSNNKLFTVQRIINIE